MHRAHPYLAPESHDLDHLIAELPRDALAHVAGFFAGIGQRVAGYATAHERSLELRRRADAEARARDRLPTVIAALIVQDLSLDEVIRQLSREGIPEPTTLYHWRRYQKVQERLRRAHRDREILRLAALGWSNAAIAEVFALSKSHISRIIQKTLRLAAERDL